MQIVIDILEGDYERVIHGSRIPYARMRNAIKNGILVNADTLAHMVINERIYGDFKQDICYEEPVIEDVKCRLELSIIDRRPCYCGAGLRETWRDKNKRNDLVRK